MYVTGTHNKRPIGYGFKLVVQVSITYFSEALLLWVRESLRGPYLLFAAGSVSGLVTKTYLYNFDHLNPTFM